jgi:hypothetical protein
MRRGGLIHGESVRQQFTVMKEVTKTPLAIEGKNVEIYGVFPRIAKLRSEHHQYIEAPEEAVRELKRLRPKADVFTFLQPVAHEGSPYAYPSRPEEIAVLTLDSYENWWTKQVNDKTRNMVRKAGKKGVTIQIVPFSDDLAKGIHAIYNESPLIQGKPSKHYGKDLATLTKAHATFLDQSVFIGAFYNGAVIGFLKMIVHPNQRSASIMQIISLVAHRDKAPTNGLLAKAVEVCAERRMRYLQYGIWSRRTLGEFKKHHGFKLMVTPRYYMPLNLRGRAALALRFHRRLSEFVPGSCQDAFANLRSKWYLFKYRAQMQSQGL